jgi:hypothetical protein
MSDITLQINLSPGDIHYADLTVPALIEAHRANVQETLVIVDCCRPQKTRILDPDRSFPELEFNRRVEKISTISEALKAKGYIDRLVFIRSGDPLLTLISKKYLANLIKETETHDFRGAGLMAYLAGLELSKTRYVLHYDADMLLYQELGYDWATEAIDTMNQFPHVLAIVPRTSPPFTVTHDHPDAPSLYEGRTCKVVKGGWINDWFNTQCFLMDQEKLSHYLPLIQGKTFLQYLVFKYIQRTLPKSPEMMLIRQVGGNGGRRLVMNSKRAWLLHPTSKPNRYIELLPSILKAINQGCIPTGQEGNPNVQLTAWDNFLTEDSSLDHPLHG